MRGNDILHESKNAENLKELIARKKFLVPFIGAGFSVPACPTWSKFLDLFFDGIKDEFFLDEDKKHYKQLKDSGHDKKFEKMADFLVNKAGRRKFEEEITAYFDRSVQAAMKPKFNLLRRAFPGLKITTNFDCLLENHAPGIWVCYGDRADEMDKKFTHFDQNSLLKIHGGLRDIHSIVLDSSRYASLYGHPDSFDPLAPLPLFLKRVFTGCSLLFIGCSLVHDRTIMIMESLKDMRPHFAVMKRPRKKKDRVEMNRRLSRLGITPIWIEEFAQIEEILGQLAGPGPDIGIIDHDVPFVGRVEQLEQIRENLEQSGGSGNVQMITGRLFSIEGAGGVGKTTLAIEAARRFKGAFRDGVLKPVRVDEHTPVSFAVHLAAQLHEGVEEPVDAESARALVTRLLQDRRCLVILDNALDWSNIKHMLPVRTASTLLITTRNRDIFRHLRLKCKEIKVHEISLEKFTPGEALALFKEMLAAEYEEAEQDIYREIARDLGYLPIALRQAISLMVFTPHYRAAELRDKLAGEDRLELLRKGQAAADSDARVIETVFDLSTPLLTGELRETLEYLAVCSPGPVPLDFLRQLAKNEGIVERLEQLYTFPWCERRESDGERAYELHQLVRELVRGRFANRFQDGFIQLVHDIFTDEGVHFSLKEKFYLQLEEALAAAAGNGDKRLIDLMASHDLYYFCTYRGFADFYIRLTQRVEELFPGDRWALRTAYGNRALIYKMQGKLEAALKYHKKQEPISEELGDRAGLSACYGNQALILSDWGKLTEAMELHKKEETICEELGDRAGLGRTWWNQGLVYNQKKNYKKQCQLWQKSIQINKEIGIPTEIYEKALAELVKEKKRDLGSLRSQRE
jgi:tetratricopeptide (TPR) repeat protein